MFSKFFIERPIFANVIAYVTVLLGLVTLVVLPIEQYPQITPPTTVRKPVVSSRPIKTRPVSTPAGTPERAGARER